MTELPDMLTDDRIIEIAKKYAQDLAVSYLDITTAPVIDSMGDATIEITFTLAPGSSAAMGDRPALLVSQLIKGLADEGEPRFPIIRYEGKGVTAPSS